MDKDHSLDCFGLLCPMPIIKISEKIEDIGEGQILEIIATDEGIKEDARAWCRSTGHELVAVEVEESDPRVYRVYIRK